MACRNETVSQHWNAKGKFSRLITSLGCLGTNAKEEMYVA